MHDTNILELRKTAENEWKARYQGSYGIYTIKITTDGKETTNFSCSCPSDHYPCKHIPMIEEAIAKRIKVEKKEGDQQGPKLEDFIKNISVEKLREFITTQAKYNPELENAVFLNFLQTLEIPKAINIQRLYEKPLSLSLLMRMIIIMKIGKI